LIKLSPKGSKLYSEHIVAYIEKKLEDLQLLNRLEDTGLVFRMNDQEIDLFAKIPAVMEALGVKQPKILSLLGTSKLDKLPLPARKMIIKKVLSLALDQVGRRISNDPERIDQAMKDMADVLIAFRIKYREIYKAENPNLVAGENHVE